MRNVILTVVSGFVIVGIMCFPSIGKAFYILSQRRSVLDLLTLMQILAQTTRAIVPMLNPIHTWAQILINMVRGVNGLSVVGLK